MRRRKVYSGANAVKEEEEEEEEAFINIRTSSCSIVRAEVSISPIRQGGREGGREGRRNSVEKREEGERGRHKREVLSTFLPFSSLSF